MSELLHHGAEAFDFALFLKLFENDIIPGNSKSLTPNIITANKNSDAIANHILEINEATSKS
jgi:hypothetical protein